MASRPNNFDTLRTLAAVAVLVSHSFPLSYGSNRLEPIFRLSQGKTTAGSLAVALFFIISGYLITMSFQRTGSVRLFAMNRALRLLPALAVFVMVLAFVAGPILSSDPTAIYFRSWSTYAFPLINLSLLDWAGFLPGVFTHNPFPRFVDGSLWTLHHEAECYVVVLLLGCVSILNRYVVASLFVAGLLSLDCHVGGRGVELLTYFLAGATLYLWNVPLRRDVAWICLGLWLASLVSVHLHLASATVGAYLVIFAALSPTVRLPDLARHGDLSYGIYIWAFPVEQVLAELLGRHVSWPELSLLSLPIVLGLAFTSWHCVEAPALALKRRRHRTGPRDRPSDLPIALDSGLTVPHPSPGA